MKSSTLIGIFLVANLVLSCAVTNQVSDTETNNSESTVKTPTEIEVVEKDETTPTEETIDEVQPNQKKWTLDETFTKLNHSGVDSPILFNDKKNITYILYIKKPERSIKILKYNNNIWEPLSTIGLPSEKVFSAGLSFDNNNTPYIYYDGEKGNVIKFSEGKWVKVGEPFSKGEALSIKLSFDNTNNPWVAYGDSENDIKSTVKKYSLGKWNNIGSGLPATSEPIYLSHDFEFPLLMTKTANFGVDPIQTYQLVNNKWTLKSKGESVISSHFLDVLVLNGNEIYLAYADKQTDYKLTVKKFIKNEWILVGKNGITEGECRAISIEKNENNLLTVVCYDNGSKSVVKIEWTGTTWKILDSKYQYKSDLVSRSSTSNNNVSYIMFSNKEKSQLFKLDK